jgi:hypothetical protein
MVLEFSPPMPNGGRLSVVRLDGVATAKAIKKKKKDMRMVDRQRA